MMLLHASYYSFVENVDADYVDVALTAVVVAAAARNEVFAGVTFFDAAVFPVVAVYLPVTLLPHFCLTKTFH